MLRRRPFATLTLIAGLAAPAAAQDSHYWTYGYGPIGQLTEGTLVGGVSDLSATFYNPAACALIDRPRFVFNLSSIDIARIDVPDAAGPGLDFDQLVFRVVPAMIAFHVGHHEDTGNHFAFAFLSRYDSDFDLGYNDVDVSGLKPDASAGFGRYKQRVLEYWLGGTWSRRVGRRASRSGSRRSSPTAHSATGARSRSKSSRRTWRAGRSSAARTSTTTCGCWPSSASPGGPAPGSSAPR